MKCISSFLKKAAGILLCPVLIFSGCSGAQTSYGFPYSRLQEGSSFTYEDVVTPFSAELCVVDGDVADGSIDFEETESGAIFDLTRRETLYAYRAHERMDPASMTKVMTALVAIENAPLDQKLVCHNSSYITERGAQLLDMEEGEQMTLHQALHFLLVFSANDVAMMIAENICGDVDTFVKLMNEKAVSLGATNSHFSNPHGLTEADQYVTAYDMYLIFLAAMEHEVLQQIVRLPSYKTQYTRADGTVKEAEVMNTNAFLRENSGISAPAGVTVIGGKTGSTFAAGECLVMMVRDVNGDPYIAVVMHSSGSGSLYRRMSQLLEKATIS